MAAAASTTENELPKEQSLGKIGDTTANKPQKSEKNKPVAGKKTAKQVQIKEKKVKPRTKTAPKRKSNKKGNVRMTKKLLGKGINNNTRPKRSTQPAKKSVRTRKENAKFRGKKKSPLNVNINGGGEKNVSNRHDKTQSRPIPLVLPSTKPRGGVTRSSVKYTLKRAESNRDHRIRVLTNKRRFGRRNRPTTRKKHSRSKYFAEYWCEPEVTLDDLSSLDCGSYSDNVEEELSTTQEEGKVEELFSLPIPQDFVFNINAPEFIPKETGKKRTNIFTLSELVESLKGQQLPSMPELDSSYLRA